jgi:autophagy-related protein 2
MRKRLEKIRQLLATGQAPDDSIEQTSAVLFSSVHLGLSSDTDEWDTGALIAAIDQELDDDLETATQSSWQSFAPRTEGSQSKPKIKSKRLKKLTRANKASVEICLQGLRAEVDNFRDDEPLASRVFATVRDLEILDHMKTSTWKKFLTSMRSDSRGNVRETDSSMVRFELRNIRPVASLRDEEARLRVRVAVLGLWFNLSIHPCSSKCYLSNSMLIKTPLIF